MALISGDLGRVLFWSGVKCPLQTVQHCGTSDEQALRGDTALVQVRTERNCQSCLEKVYMALALRILTPKLARQTSPCAVP